MVRKTSNHELARVSVEEFKNSSKMPLVVVLDNIRSMHNVGAVFRTSDAFLVEKIILTGITACPPHREIHKTALGATESVEWTYVKETLDAVKMLRSEGYLVYAVEQAQPSIMLDQLQVENKERLAVVFGNEVFGVHDDVIQAVDACIEIPQFGTKHSLNISVSAGLVIWEIFRQQKKAIPVSRR
jgi:tRNA G18 (ribose-2'-O)-methylase SpoU